MEREQRATDVVEALGVADLGLETLRRAYTGGETTPRRLITRLLGACRDADPTIWVRLLTGREVEPYLARLDSASPEELPLYGVPFAIKDNIDLEGVPTTAACPAYAYTPERSAFVVERLVAAGAVPVGKTNMDQFATGLVGVRSPYGACRNSFDPDYIAGGSSSGSALAVALGLASFSLGTDTAGSGRVPAAFNNLVGLKPSRGALSASGVVPACRSLDCVSIFSLSAGDARDVLRVAAAPDDDDPYARGASWMGMGADAGASPDRFRFGVPRPEQLEFFGNHGYAECFAKSIALLEGCGGEAVEVDFAPFLEAARLLYEGPWVAERYAAVGEFIEKLPQAVHPVTLEIIRGGASATAADAFRAMHRLQALKKRADAVLGQVDFLFTPTTGTCYTLAEVNAEPIACNSRLGYYTNYVNLLDYCALAAPAAFAGNLPFGVTLVGPAFSEPLLLGIGARLHTASRLSMGTGKTPPPPWKPMEPAAQATVPAADSRIAFAVCGAHLSGLPLNPQLTGAGGRLLEVAKTAPCYRMYALAGSVPPKPGLVRSGSGAALPVEIWDLPADAFGRFVAAIPHPLGMGKLELEDGRWVEGFIAEPCVAESGADITRFGGWRVFLESGGKP